MKIEVCAGSRCLMAGSELIFDMAEQLAQDILNAHPELDESDIEVVSVPCQKVCSCDACANDECQGPVVFIDGDLFCRTSSQEVMSKMLEVYPLAD